MATNSDASSLELKEVYARIRALRLYRQITLQQLSRQTSVSIGMLSQIERGRSSPSVRTLLRLADALGVHPGWFFIPSQLSQMRPSWVFPRSCRRNVALDGVKIFKELLAPPEGGKVELSLVTIGPGGCYGAAGHARIGEDAGVVLEGRLVLEIDGVPVALESGDTFRFSSSLSHCVENRDATETRVLWASTRAC